jgi:hypothetical protein
LVRIRNSTRKKEVHKKKCSSCNKQKPIDTGFYISNSTFDSDGRTGVCKECYKSKIDYNNLQSIKDILRELNRPFIAEVWNSSLEEGQRRNRKDYFGIYIKNIQMNKYKDLGWNDSENLSKTEVEILSLQSIYEEKRNIYSEEDEQNKNDVINMLGYDPFINESNNDKKFLYNRLIDYLDESTLEDNFKLNTVIEIVKTFAQIEKINNAIAVLSQDPKSTVENNSTIKSLSTTKKDMLSSTLNLAKDNGISANHNNNKSKGGNTLNGIVKKLNEIGLESATVNLFELETCDAMKQIADISNRSILDQLILDENDYAEMLNEQRVMIQKYQSENAALEEENRILKIKLKVLTGGDAPNELYN